MIAKIMRTTSARIATNKGLLFFQRRSSLVAKDTFALGEVMGAEDDIA